MTKNKNMPVPIMSTTMGMPHSTLLFNVESADMKMSNMNDPLMVAHG